MLIKTHNMQTFTKNIQKYSKFFLVLALIIVIVVVFRVGLLDQLTLENLQNNSIEYQNFISQNWFLSLLVYFVIYFSVIAFSFPGATVMTLAGGFFFGLWGILIVNLSATTGASLAFLVSRYIFGKSLQEKYRNQLTKLNQDLEENGSNYLLTLRLIPIFPFFLINLLAGLTKVRFWSFFWTTAIGTLPGTVAYVYAGTRLSQINSTSDILSLELLLALVGLALVSLLPVIFKKFRKPKAKNN